MKIDAEARRNLECLQCLVGPNTKGPNRYIAAALDTFLREAETLEPTPSQQEALDALDAIEDFAYDAGGVRWVFPKIKTVRHFIEQAGAVPEGWQLVPVEPTKEMCLEGSPYIRPIDSNPMDGRPSFEEKVSAAYRSMLAAAPKQEDE